MGVGERAVYMREAASVYLLSIVRSRNSCPLDAALPCRRPSTYAGASTPRVTFLTPRAVTDADGAEQCLSIAIGRAAFAIDIR